MVFNLISFFAGFLASSIIDTSLGEFNEWAIVGASLVVASLEVMSKIYYTTLIKINHKNIKYSGIKLFNLINALKVGIIYGLIVDAFKLGS